MKTCPKAKNKLLDKHQISIINNTEIGKAVAQPPLMNYKHL